uniref:Uncharacterized protein n=1 Tax=Strigamia maritima TaxID=126957 RepID=T1JC04_STRMM
MDRQHGQFIVPFKRVKTPTTLRFARFGRFVVFNYNAIVDVCVFSEFSGKFEIWSFFFHFRLRASGFGLHLRAAPFVALIFRAISARKFLICLALFVCFFWEEVFVPVSGVSRSRVVVTRMPGVRIAVSVVFWLRSGKSSVVGFRSAPRVFAGFTSRFVKPVSGSVFNG